MSGMRGPQSARRAERRPGGAGRSGQAIVGLVRGGVRGRAPAPRSRAWPRATCGCRAPEGWPLRACGGSRGCRPASQARDIELVGGDVHLLAPDVDLDRRERQALEVGKALERLAISPVRPVEPALDGLGRHHALREAGGRTAVGEIGLEAADRHVPRGEADERRRAEPGELGARPLENPADGETPELVRRARLDEALLRLLGDVPGEAIPPRLARIERRLERRKRGGIARRRPADDGNELVARPRSAVAIDDCARQRDATSGHDDASTGRGRGGDSRPRGARR